MKSERLEAAADAGELVVEFEPLKCLRGLEEQARAL